MSDLVGNPNCFSHAQAHLKLDKDNSRLMKLGHKSSFRANVRPNFVT